MKVLITTIVAILPYVTCEVPPPYPTRGFRPSPTFNLPTQFRSSQTRQPQTSYGIPNLTPPRLSFPPVPQTVYGVPNRQPNLTPSSSSKQTIPSTSYGVPIVDSGSSRNTLRIVNNQIQNQPQTQYGAPNSGDIETLEQIRKLSQLLQSKQIPQSLQRGQLFQNSNRGNIPSSQYLPQSEASNFRGNSQLGNSNLFQSQNANVREPSVQYLPSREIAHFQLTSTEFGDSNRNTLGQNIQQQQELNQPQFFLPVKDASNFKQGFQLPDIDLPNTNIDSPHRLTQNTINPTSSRPQLLQPSTQYVPSKQSAVTRPSISNNQPIPRPNFSQRQPSNINDILSRPDSNEFGRPNQQQNFDIEPADVRKIEPPSRNEDKFQAPGQSVGSTVRPSVGSGSIGQINSETPAVRPGKTYLVPTSTPRSPNRQLGRPNTAFDATEAPLQNNDEPTESDEQAGAGGPNVAIATAVSGSPSGQGFYLLQPDGRLQRVVYEKIQETGDQENEYTANYLFQNIQPNPSLAYSPLIALGK